MNTRCPHRKSVNESVTREEFVQRWADKCCWYDGDEVSDDDEVGWLSDTGPVSYTHLDVYKRQIRYWGRDVKGMVTEAYMYGIDDIRQIIDAKKQA